jgi:hypothetical protein
MGKTAKKLKRLREPMKASLHAGVGAVAGASAVTATGMTAVGIVGTGAGIGAAAGPVGIAVGALGGLAVYGLKKAFKKQR